MGNQYSAAWFERFLHSIAPAQTAREVAFLERRLPLPTYRRVLDLACGEGRHAHALAEHSYQVTGVDRDAAALAAARLAGSEADFVEEDMQHVDRVPGIFDAVTIMWQSFVNFDDATN